MAKPICSTTAISATGSRPKNEITNPPPLSTGTALVYFLSAGSTFRLHWGPAEVTEALWADAFPRL